jgi:hypothetical protein
VLAKRGRVFGKKNLDGTYVDKVRNVWEKNKTIDDQGYDRVKGIIGACFLKNGGLIVKEIGREA